MTPPLTRREFLKATVIAPAAPLLDAVYIEPRWREERSVEFMLDESSYLFTGPGVWSEGPEEEGAFDYPLEIYAKLTRGERKVLKLRKGEYGVLYVGDWENEDLNAFGRNLNELGIPLYLSNDWRWMGDWFSS